MIGVIKIAANIYELEIEARKALEEQNYKEAAILKRKRAKLYRSWGDERTAHLLECSAFEYEQLDIYEKAGMDVSCFPDVPPVERLKYILTELSDDMKRQRKHDLFIECKELNMRLCRAQGKETDAFLVERELRQYGWIRGKQGNDLFPLLVDSYVKDKKKLEQTAKVLKDGKRIMQAYHNKYGGRKCFLIGNGPSLRASDLNELKGEICFACNKIYYIFDQTDWRPDFYCCSDYDFIQDNRDKIQSKIDCPWFASVCENDIQEIPDRMIVLRKQIPSNDSESLCFSQDLSEFVTEGKTVMYMMLQIAVYMGFSEIYLLGVDNEYDRSRGLGGNIITNPSIRSNHFYDDSCQGRTPLPELASAESAFRTAADFAVRHHIKIMNATRGGKLEVFPRVRFEKAVGRYNIKVSDYDWENYNEGICDDLYYVFGSHYDGRKGTRFALWAPHASGVSVVGDFNNWHCEADRMQYMGNGIYEIYIAGAFPETRYQYCITAKSGKQIYKSDPYANRAELRPGRCSVVMDETKKFYWEDDIWLKNRKQMNCEKEPIAIYEVYPGSWESGFTYRGSAQRLLQYIKSIGYTHVEFFGILEYPFDGSWGYQVTGYFSPTARYGTPDDFRYLINLLHKNGIGVILDWIPAHFCGDQHGLAEFDGERLYEYQDEEKGNNTKWGTRIFDYSNRHICSFLLSSAVYWLDCYHIDGLRVDAVTFMLYHPKGHEEEGRQRENENQEALSFLRNFNTSLGAWKKQGVFVIAEESTAWPKVTGTPEEGGIGFDFKWNLGWRWDFLMYMGAEFEERKQLHNKANFSMAYHHLEKYMLAFSHDEVAPGFRSMFSKMPGTEKEKIRNLKLAYTWLIGHPGKKLLFMGQDLGQIEEWNINREIQWGLLEDSLHFELLCYVKELLNIYKKYPALYVSDYETTGFQWVNADDCDRSIFSFERNLLEGNGKSLLFIFNFRRKRYKDYRVGAAGGRNYRLIESSIPFQKVRMAGSVLKPEEIKADGRSYSIGYCLAPLEAAVFSF